MREVWQIVAAMTRGNFIAARDKFVAANGEPKRAFDANHFSESYSPLHNVNPNMVPMTYHGIAMLDGLHQDNLTHWCVPPLTPSKSPDDTVTLLEVMPGAILKSCGLPHKGFKKGKQALALRDRILNGLAAKSGVPLPNLFNFKPMCLANDDCLDAVVAAVAAAMWAKNKALFHLPENHKNPAVLLDARLEGCIYAPL